MDDLTFKNRYRGALSVHLAIVCSVFTYLIILWVIYMENQEPLANTNISYETSTMLFMLITILLVVAGFGVTSYRKKWIRNYEPPKEKKLDSNGKEINFFGRYLSFYFISIAFLEVFVIAGLVVYFVSANIKFATICLVIEVIVIALNGPQKAELEALRKKEDGDDFTKQGFKIS
ncbi:MAG: hypothetical protein ACK5LP_03845 [Campylobacteraceae bacterium]